MDDTTKSVPYRHADSKMDTELAALLLILRYSGCTLIRIPTRNKKRNPQSDSSEQLSAPVHQKQEQHRKKGS